MPYKKSQVNTNLATYDSLQDLYLPRYSLPEINVTGSTPRILPKQDKPYWVTANTGLATFEDVVKGIDLTAGPLLHLALPSLYVGAARDAINGQNPFVSLMRGNSGVFNENFNQEHPYLGMFANGVVDIAALNKLSELSNLSNKGKSLVSSLGSSYSSGRRILKSVDESFPIVFPSAGAVGGAMLGDYIGERTGGKVGFTIGAGLGSVLGFTLLHKNINKEPFFPRLYRMANDVIQRPVSTAIATIKNEYPWTRRLYFRNVRKWHEDIDKAREWLESSGYYREDQPSVLILKHKDYGDTYIGQYNSWTNHTVVQPTLRDSNLPLNYRGNELTTFRGVVNHELLHGRLNYFGGLSEPGSGYYVPKETIDMKSLDPFRRKVAGTWEASPDEFDSELSNLLFITGKSPVEPITNTEPLQRRFNITDLEVRDLENDILDLRRDNVFLW